MDTLLIRDVVHRHNLGAITITILICGPSNPASPVQRIAAIHAEVPYVDWVCGGCTLNKIPTRYVGSLGP